VATAEAAAVEVVRTLCGSVGLIAAVLLTILLAAALAPQGDEAVDGRVDRARVGPSDQQLGSRIRQHVGWAPADSSLVFEHVLSLHEPRLSHASLGIGGALPLDKLQPDARRAALELKLRVASCLRQS
jgi:hypothetical protein